MVFMDFESDGSDEYYCSPQSFDGDIESPSDMMVDPDDYIGQDDLSEKDDVAIINPDQLGNDVERIRADDCMSPKPIYSERVLTGLEIS
jgi:hypothetical protein